MNDYTTHASYKTCNHCGANLDHDERCDCRDPHCKKCGTVLRWGKFAHNQEICWNCYKTTCLEAIAKISDPIERQFLEHAIRIVAEINREVF